jgi:hypothetical protein
VLLTRRLIRTLGGPDEGSLREVPADTPERHDALLRPEDGIRIEEAWRFSRRHATTEALWTAPRVRFLLAEWQRLEGADAVQTLVSQVAKSAEVAPILLRAFTEVRENRRGEQIAAVDRDGLDALIGDPAVFRDVIAETCRERR